jgi:hypothetical protein
MWGVTLSYFPGQRSGGSIITTNLTRTSGYGYRRILENERVVASGLYRSRLMLVPLGAIVVQSFYKPAT